MNLQDPSVDLLTLLRTITSDFSLSRPQSIGHRGDASVNQCKLYHSNNHYSLLIHTVKTTINNYNKLIEC